MRSVPTALALAALTAGLLVAAPPASTSPGPADRGIDLEVYVVEAAPADLEKLEEVGLDTEHAVQSEGAQGKIRLDAVITEDQADLLRAEGLSVQVKKINGRTASEAARLQNLAGYDAYRSYSEPGGIADELRETAAANPGITKLVTIGKTVQGQDILALKVTKNARTVKDGKRPVGPLRRRSARARVDHARDGPPPDALLPGRLRQRPAADPDHQDHGAVVPARRPTLTATTTRSAPSDCGARTSGTTTAMD